MRPGVRLRAEGALPTSAADAVVCLKKSVRQDVTLSCPCTPTTTAPGATSTTAPATTSTTVSATTTTNGASTTTTLAANVETQVFPHACVTVTLRPTASFTTTVRGSASITVAIDHDTIGDRDGDGLEDVSGQVTDFLLVTSNPLLGTITVKLPDPDIDPGQDRRTHGSIEETENATPGVLDVPPYALLGNATMRSICSSRRRSPAARSAVHGSITTFRSR